MKKNTKFLALLLTLLIMCLCLSGCDELDEMREQQAFWTEEGSYDSITYNGQEYKRLPGYNQADPMYNDGISEFMNVTDKDVPVLLSSSFANYMHLSSDKNFLAGYLHDNSAEWYNATIPVGDVLYCKEDIYDEVKSKIEKGINYTKYGFGFYRYDEEEMTDQYEYYYLTDEEIDAVNKVINEVKPVEREFNDNQNYVLSIDKVSEDKYFGKTGFELYTDSLNTYYFVQYSEALDIYKYYEVPNKLNPIFENLQEIASHASMIF